MNLKISCKSPVKNEYSKIYMKLIALEINPDIPDKVLKGVKDREGLNKLRIEHAKSYFRNNYK